MTIYEKRHASNALPNRNLIEKRFRRKHRLQLYLENNSVSIAHYIRGIQRLLVCSNPAKKASDVVKVVTRDSDVDDASRLTELFEVLPKS